MIEPKSTNNEWSTPQDLFFRLHERFNFTLDPCCEDEIADYHGYNNIGSQLYGIEHFNPRDNGLSQDWKGKRVFMNPPYNRGELEKWTKKAHDEHFNNNVFIVGLIPNSSDTSWYHKYIEGKAIVKPVKGRLKFGEQGSARFPSILVYWI